MARVNRRRLVIGALLVVALAAVGLALTGHLPFQPVAEPAPDSAQTAALDRARRQARARAARAAASRAGTAVAAGAAATRTADASHASALFAGHSWYVAPPPPPPPPPAPPPEATAPPFPYTVMGAYAAEGGKTVYFLARGDRVIDAHVGDRLDGVYDFESADAGQLVFNYLPLNIRQPISTGVKP